MTLAASRRMLERFAPGLLIVAITALAARFVSDHYATPAMLIALLFGIALNFLSSEPRTQDGIAFCARSLLRISVALLGFRISVDLIAALGPWSLALVISGVCTTVIFGLMLGKMMRLPQRFAFLTAGSVAICGASAAMAIAALMPKDDKRETQLTFTVATVTVLSTFAMILYPILADLLGLSPLKSGVFLGATIHDVAQVVGAGFSVSETTGEVSTTVKLVRVAMLGPVILVASIYLRNRFAEPHDAATRPALIPWFVGAFFGFACLNTFGLVHDSIAAMAISGSRWGLLCAIVAVGMKTSIGDILKVGVFPFIIVGLETIFIAAWVLLPLSIFEIY